MWPRYRLETIPTQWPVHDMVPAHSGFEVTLQAPGNLAVAIDLVTHYRERVCPGGPAALLLLDNGKSGTDPL
jgi:hypothetical protein